MARNQIAKKVIREDFSGVDFNFSDGAVLSALLANIPTDLHARLACHGLSQKVGDAYAGAKDANEAFDWATTTAELLYAGDWREARAEGGPGARPSRVIQAVIRTLTDHGKTFDEAALAEKYKSKEARDKAMANAEVKAHFDAIAVEEAQKKADASKAAAAGVAADVDELAA